jgi:lipoyltransferase 1
MMHFFSRCDGGRELVMQQRGFQLINPTEKWFPGLNELRENFNSWDWRYGKTPNFTVGTTIELKTNDECHNSMKVSVDVEKVSFIYRELCSQIINTFSF